MTLRGSCHCGAIGWTLDERPTRAIECNCSHCQRKGYLLAFVDADGFRLDTPRDAVGTYNFNKHVIHHHFCKVCGCAPFAEGSRDGRPMVAVNLRCADDFDFSNVEITQVDGASV